jgi:hypothetical protein
MTIDNTDWLARRKRELKSEVREKLIELGGADPLQGLVRQAGKNRLVYLILEIDAKSGYLLGFLNTAIDLPPIFPPKNAA